MSNYLAVVSVAECLFAVASLSLILFAYERTLVPLYGFGPTTSHLHLAGLAATVFTSVQPFRISSSNTRLLSGLILSLAPNASYWVATWTARRKDVFWGPLTTHAIVLGPLVFILTSVINNALHIYFNRTQTQRTSILYRFASTSFAYIISSLVATHVWTHVSALNAISDSQMFLFLAGCSYALWISLYPSPEVHVPSNKNTKKIQKKLPYTSSQIKVVVFIAFIGLWLNFQDKLSNPVLPHPLHETYTHPFQPLQIHSSVQSNTGLIVVGEMLPPADDLSKNREMHSARYLRASHSILGGVWTHNNVQTLDNIPPVTDSFGAPLGDSIYATFVIQEAARLVNSTDKGKTGNWEHALVIGLGAGISAASFMRHGISTSIVEIDPAVYEAARTYFGLPDPGPGKVFLEDARTWAARRKDVTELGTRGTLFDIVVHDCFSGGGVPEHIFTSEFWEDIKAAMQPDGILVVNFAGVLAGESSLMIVYTLEESFGKCRAFHDVFGELPDEKYQTEFVNMVIFCSKSAQPITFRKSNNPDYLGSPLRRHVLQSMPHREVKLNLIRKDHSEENDAKYLLKDAHNPLGSLQKEQGGHHWELMRQVLPDVHWETY
ncbi:spermidine synthase [Cyathus striatus]|nr:spermidine synthase [Cyathus striatus]